MEERVEMVREEIGPLMPGATEFEVKPFSNLLMHFAMDIGAVMIIRGLRAVSDFEYEFQMVGMNARLNSDIETVFLMASDNHQFIARLEEHTSELQSLMRHSNAVFCLQKKKNPTNNPPYHNI